MRAVRGPVQIPVALDALHQQSHLGLQREHRCQCYETARLVCLFRYVSLIDLLGAVEVLSLHAPLTPATRHLMNRERFAALRRGVLFVNTARGALVDTVVLTISDVAAGQSKAGTARSTHKLSGAVTPSVAAALRH